MSSTSPTSPSSPSPTLVDQAKWFRDEVHPHESQLKSYLRGAFPSIRDVDDLVQDSYVRVWKRQLSRPIESTKSFLFTVARRLALDSVRRQRTRAADSVGDFDESYVIKSGENATNLQETVDLLSANLTKLPDRPRDIILLKRFDGLSTREVAERLGISEKTVEEHFTRGMKRLGDLLRAQGITRLFD